jgi:signal transduction histidine kinase
VAHDLRTPLQAFASELEVLRHNLSGQQLQPESQSASQISSIKQLDRLCHFMNMTINRSIDFTKVSTGLKLNPSIESVSLRDTIGWAVECMVNTHGNVPIVFPDVPSDVHNQIFTDKQWLTENLLCLMSNAQKFTTEGDITIRCTLIPPAVDKFYALKWRILPLALQKRNVKNFLDPFSRFDISYVC